MMYFDMIGVVVDAKEAKNKDLERFGRIIPLG